MKIITPVATPLVFAVKFFVKKTRYKGKYRREREIHKVPITVSVRSLGEDGCAIAVPAEVLTKAGVLRVFA